MGIKQIIALESDTVSESTIRIPFEFACLDSVPEGKRVDKYITITPLTVRSWFRLKPLLLAIDPEDLEVIVGNGDGTFDPRVPEVMGKYDELILSVICIGLHNKKSDPPAWFRQVLKDNCTWEDTRILLNAVLFRVGYNPFYKSIMTLKNMSPLNEAEIIAARKNLKSWIIQ